MVATATAACETSSWITTTPTRYASAYDLCEDVEALDGKQLSAAPSSIGGAEDNIAACWVEQMAAMR